MTDLCGINEKCFSVLADTALDETEKLKREIACLEAQIPDDNERRAIVTQIREETGELALMGGNIFYLFLLEHVWKEKYSVLVEESSSLTDLITVLQEVKFNVLCQKNLIKDVTTPFL